MKKLLFLFIIIMFTTTLIVAQETQPKGTGVKLGAIIKNVIDTALPGVGNLLNLIWPKRVDGQDKRRATKIEVEDLTKVAQKKMRIKIANEANKIEPIVLELNTVNQFQTPSFFIKKLLSEITFILAEDNISKEKWGNVKKNWDEIYKKIKEIKKIDIENIRESSIKILLKDISEVNEYNIFKIKRDYISKDVQFINNQIQKKIELNREISKFNDKFTKLEYLVDTIIKEFKKEFAIFASVLKGSEAVSILSFNIKDDDIIMKIDKEITEEKSKLKNEIEKYKKTIK